MFEKDGRNTRIVGIGKGRIILIFRLVQFVTQESQKMELLQISQSERNVWCLHFKLRAPKTDAQVLFYLNTHKDKQLAREGTLHSNANTSLGEKLCTYSNQ